MHIFQAVCISCKEDLLPDRNQDRWQNGIGRKDICPWILLIQEHFRSALSSLLGCLRFPALRSPFPRELSLSPDITAQPYSEYNIQVTAEGFEPVLVSGSEILAGEFSLQPIRMNPLNVTEEEENVASSEIYSTWPESAIYANILLIQSFTLNRVYTEW